MQPAQKIPLSNPGAREDELRAFGPHGVSTAILRPVQMLSAAQADFAVLDWSHPDAQHVEPHWRPAATLCAAGRLDWRHPGPDNGRQHVAARAAVFFQANPVTAGAESPCSLPPGERPE